MNKFKVKILLGFFFTTTVAFSQVGIGNTDPKTSLDITGALSLREGTALSLSNGVNNNIGLGTTPSSFYRITGPTAAFSITSIVPATGSDGQIVTIQNTTTFPMTITHEGASGTAANRIFCPNATDFTLTGQYTTVTLSYNLFQSRWSVISNSASETKNWSTTGNTGTTAGTNYIGTNDVQDFVIKTSAVTNTPLERMKITSAGNVGINATTPTAVALLTINPNTSTISSGIDMTLTNATATATGLNITTDNSNVNGITVTNTSTATSASLYGIGGILSSTNIVSGYNGYRNGTGLSYGIYGINGTNTTYATNASTWAAFLRGRTVISSETSPTSALGTDLEVRNTTTGAAAPATVSLRQTNQISTNGNVLANLNFGDNYVTTPQAQIQVLRDAAASSSSDMPTAMAFSTTPNASATLTERMRIDNAGKVGIGTTAPTTVLDVNGALSLREGTALDFSSGSTFSNVSLGTTPSSVYRITGPSAAFSLTGLVPVATSNGQIVTLINTTAYDFTIVNNATSVAANRIYCPGASDITLSGINSTVTLMYNATSSRWMVIGITDNPYGKNIKSVVGSTNINMNSTTFADMTNMSITFTPKHSTVYLNFGAAGYLDLSTTDPIGAYIEFRIVNVTSGNTTIAGTTSMASDYDDVEGVGTAWSAHFSMFPISVTAGTSTTIKIQWRRDGVTPTQAINNASSEKDYCHRNLTIYD